MTEDDTTDRPDDEAAAVAGADAGDGDTAGGDATGGATGATPADDTPDVDVEDPEEHAEQAFIDAIEALDEAPDKDEDVVESIKAEKQAVDDFADEVGRALVAGLPKQHANAYSGRLKDETSVYTKRDIVSHVEERKADIQANAASNSGGASFPPLDEWIEANLTRVVVLTTTDHRQDTTYRWHFPQGTVETAATKDGVTHFAWSHFRDEIYQALGVNTSKPKRRESEEWRQWLARLIQNRGEHKESFGPRSHAVEQIQSLIGDSVGYTELADAVERGGVHVVGAGGGDGDTDGSDDESDGESGEERDDSDDSDESDDDTAADGGTTPDAIRVPWPEISRIADDAGVEVRALQNELDARGYTHPRLNGVSERESANGRTVRVWVLTPEIGEPAVVTDDPESPAAQAADGDTSGATTGTGPIGGTGAAGQVDQIGGTPAPAPDDDESDDDATDATDEGGESA